MKGVFMENKLYKEIRIKELPMPEDKIKKLIVLLADAYSSNTKGETNERNINNQ